MTTPDPWKPNRAERTRRLPKVKLTEAPTPVLARAEQLCDLVDDADGTRPDRQDLIAALIFDAEPDGAKLAAAWQRYRVAPVHVVVIGETKTAGSLDLSKFKKR